MEYEDRPMTTKECIICGASFEDWREKNGELELWEVSLVTFPMLPFGGRRVENGNERCPMDGRNGDK